MQAKGSVLLVTPVVLLASTFLVLKWLGARFGPRLGYFLGFVFHWIGCYVLLPWWVMATDGVIAAFRDVPQPLGQPALLGAILLVAPLLLGYGHAFPRALRHANATVAAASAALALVNGSLEELLWRGAYSATFPGHWILGVLLPAVGFAVRHIAPQVVRKNRAPGGAVSFVLVSGGPGLMWGWVAFSTASILWTTVSHALFDFSGLGSRVYLGDSGDVSALRSAEQAL